MDSEIRNKVNQTKQNTQISFKFSNFDELDVDYSNDRIHSTIVLDINDLTTQTIVIRVCECVCVRERERERDRTILKKV